MQITATENKFLNSLVQDCITFHLTTEEALEYIATRFKKISPASYKRRKSFIESDHSIQLWLNHYTRIGFIQHHKEQIDIIQFIQNDSVQRLDIERRKGQRNESKILALKNDIKENAKLLSELGLGTPIVAEIKSRMQKLSYLAPRGPAIPEPELYEAEEDPKE